MFWLLFCKIFFKATVLKVSPIAGFSRKSSHLKIKQIDKLKVPFLLLHGVGGSVQSSMYTYMHTHQIVAAVGGVFIQTNFERKVKGASALYCVYILKNKVLYVFITLIIVIKGLPFLICGFGGFLFVFLFWGFVFCVFFLGKKKKQTCF